MQMLDKTYWKNHVEKIQNSIPCKPRYEIGSIVYLIKPCRLDSDKYRCPHCGGLSLLYVSENNSYRNCPYCHNGYIKVPYTMYFPIEAIVIGYHLISRKWDEHEYPVIPIGTYDDWIYFLNIEGWKSVYGHEIYISEQEAQAQCDILNEKQKEKYIQEHADYKENDADLSEDYLPE